MPGSLATSDDGAASQARSHGTLDLMRLAAAGLIVLYHYAEQAPVDLRTLHPVFSRGYLATDFFLILSGYVIARAYGARVSSGETGWATFFAKRVGRIWPLHLVVLGLFAAAVGLGEAAGLHPRHVLDFQWDSLPVEAALIQAWGFAPVQGWNEVTWSLSALVVCYAVFPMLARLEAWVRPPSVAAAVLILPALALADAVSSWVFGQSLFDLSEQFGAVRALPLFVAGMALFRLARERPMIPAVAPWVLGAAGALLAGAQAFGRFDLFSIGCILTAIWAADGVRLARLRKTAAWGARISYSLFLTHLLTATVWFGGLHAAAARGLVGDAVLWAGWAA
ncbi:MAG: acyltransferase family protein, partial [Caulobacteraceae bacterium]